MNEEREGLNGFLLEEEESPVIFFIDGEALFRRAPIRTWNDLARYIDSRGDFSHWEGELAEPVETFSILDRSVAYFSGDAFFSLGGKRVYPRLSPEGIEEAFLSAIDPLSPTCEIALDAPDPDGFYPVIFDETEREANDDDRDYIAACVHEARALGLPVR